MLRAEATAALEPVGVTLTESVLMVMLADSPGQSSAELARGIGLTPQAANLVLKELETMGMVTRPPHAPSGRARPAKLTAAGVARLRRAKRPSGGPTKGCSLGCQENVQMNSAGSLVNSVVRKLIPTERLTSSMRGPVDLWRTLRAPCQTRPG